MTQFKRLTELNKYLLEEMPQYRRQAAGFGEDEESQFRLFRSLVNLRRPKPADSEFLHMQDEYLRDSALSRGITDADSLVPLNDGLYLWRGDITTLRCDAVVNAANSGLLGCFVPCHGCIDNAIHTYAGVQLRLACAQLINKQGHEEPTGRAKITPAFNLPSRYVIHTVGPIVGDAVTPEDAALLASCYRSCLALADEKSLGSIAFCCISTGEFHFPGEKAAQTAVNTTRAYKSETKSNIKVIFNVFKQNDERIYRDLLRTDR